MRFFFLCTCPLTRRRASKECSKCVSLAGANNIKRGVRFRGQGLSKYLRLAQTEAEIPKKKKKRIFYKCVSLVGANNIKNAADLLKILTDFHLYRSERT
jgi:hypothetical protein